MAQKEMFVHLHGNHQSLLDWGMEPLTTAAIAALAGADLFKGRFVYDTDKNKIAHYNGTNWETVVDSSDLNKFGAAIGKFDASGGAVPDGTTAGQIGSGVDDLNVALATAASIQAGDYWFITTAGTIPGILGDDSLTPGDILMAVIDNPSSVAAVAQVSTYDVTGLTGDLTITVDGLALTQAFNTDAATTLSDFITAHAATINTLKAVTATSAAEVLTLTANVAGNPITSSVAGTAIASTAETVATANVSLEWVGIQTNLAEPLSLGGLKASKTAALAANTPLSFSAEVSAAGITDITNVAVLVDATGEDQTAGFRVDYTAMEVESNVAVASVTIKILGD